MHRISLERLLCSRGYSPSISSPCCKGPQELFRKRGAWSSKRTLVPTPSMPHTVCAGQIAFNRDILADCVAGKQKRLGNTLNATNSISHRVRAEFSGSSRRLFTFTRQRRTTTTSQSKVTPPGNCLAKRPWRWRVFVIRSKGPVAVSPGICVVRNPPFSAGVKLLGSI